MTGVLQTEINTVILKLFRSTDICEKEVLKQSAQAHELLARQNLREFSTATIENNNVDHSNRLVVVS